MRKILFGMAIMTLLLAGCTNVREKPDTSNLYADCGVIMDEPDEDVVVTMKNGNMFAFGNVDGDWQVGDIVSILFDDNGTEIVYDDIIISYRYSGWISDSELQNWI